MKQRPSSQTKQLHLGNYTVCCDQLLGRGATGTVYRAYHNHTQKAVAAKVVDLSTINDDATRLLLQNEKMALQTIKHPNVIQLLDIIEQDGKCFIITELCEGQTLAEFITCKSRLSEEAAMRIFRQILSGCQAITQNCIIHRDLKPTNILISHSLEPKIIDFGFCQVIQAKKVMRTFNVGSPSYMAPEAYLRTLYSEKSDSWSLGMILFEMLHGRTLDEGLPIAEYFDFLKNNAHFVSKFAVNFNESVTSILEGALKYSPEERMSISGMKYLTDVYQLKGKQSYLPKNEKPLTKLCPAPLGRPPVSHTTHNILRDTVNYPPRENVVSFNNLCSPLSPLNQNRNSKISQISLSSSSHRNSSVQRTIMGTNENYQLLANKLNGVDIHQCLSSKNVMEQRIRGPPVFRQVTVRYL